MVARRPAETQNGDTDDSEARICLGIIGAAHGVRGAMRVKTFTEAPQDLAAYGPLTDETGARVFVITQCKADKAGARIFLDGIASREAAQQLTGTALYVSRDKLPALADGDDFYHTDLIGLAVLDAKGTKCGRVAALHNFGAGDVLEVEGETGQAFYPFTKKVVPHIDLTAGHLTLEPPIENEARPPEQEGGSKGADG